MGSGIETDFWLMLEWVFRDVSEGEVSCASPVLPKSWEGVRALPRARSDDSLCWWKKGSTCHKFFSPFSLFLTEVWAARILPILSFTALPLYRIIFSFFFWHCFKFLSRLVVSFSLHFFLNQISFSSHINLTKLYLCCSRIKFWKNLKWNNFI